MIYKLSGRVINKYNQLSAYARTASVNVFTNWINEQKKRNYIRSTSFSSFRNSFSRMFSSWKFGCVKIQQRWVLAIMGALALANAYTMRICLSLAITEMAVSSSSNSTSFDDTCPASDSTSSSSSGGTYHWDEYTKGIILSSFFWGYLFTQVPGGLLADRYGGKHTLGLGILSTAIFTIITPLVVERFEATGLIVLRVLMGLGEGTTLPAMSVLIAQWAPPHERAKLGTVAMTGVQIGTILGNALTGVMIQNSPIGWPIVFYVYGGLSIVWFVFWCLFCYSSPDVHPFLSEEEKNHLHETMKEHTHRVTAPTPWRAILTSVPLWGLLGGKLGHDWGFFVMVTDLPLYMSSVLKFSIQTNGLLTALPYVFMWLASIMTSWLADWLIKTGIWSTTTTRKVLTTVSSVIPAIFIIAASYAGCDRTTVVLLFTIGMTFMGPYYPGLMVNGIDLSPNYTGAVTGLMALIGAAAGTAAPYLVGVLTPNQTVTEWRVVFWMTFGIFLVANLIFVIWADGNVQWWNDPEEHARKKQRDLEGRNPPLETGGSPLKLENSTS